MQSPDFPLRIIGSTDSGIFNPRWATLGQANAILNGKNTYHPAEKYRGTLSIKCVMSGQAVYEVEGGRFALNQASYLVLNNQQNYTLTIDSDTVVETFCLFFRPGFAEEILQSLVTLADRLLDDPLKSARQPVLFFERLYPHDDLLPIILNLRAATQNGSATPDWMDEQFHILLERMLYAHRGICREVETMPAMRSSTRAEIYLRLYRARDWVSPEILYKELSKSVASNNPFRKGAFDATTTSLYRSIQTRRCPSGQRAGQHLRGRPRPGHP